MVGAGASGVCDVRGASLLGLTAEAIRLTYMPILAVDRLGVSLGALGLLLAVAPAVELAAMPAAGALADRQGLKPCWPLGSGFGMAGFVAFADQRRSRRLGRRAGAERLLHRDHPRARYDVRPAATPVRRRLRYLSVLRRPSPVGDHRRMEPAPAAPT